MTTGPAPVDDPMALGPAPRHFLFLQGPLSPLYAHLADLLERAGHRVSRINLCVGDAWHWRRPGARSFRGRLSAWPDFIAGYLEREAVSDIVLHGDRRDYHRVAADCAHARGIRVIATELGYLRPDWMTIELDATAGGSRFPHDPAGIRRLAAGLPRPDLAPRYPSHFSRVAIPDVVYNLANTFLWFLYPGYRRHTVYFPPLEYAAWLLRLATRRRRETRAAKDLQRLFDERRPFFVLPLQLQGDFQIRAHSPFSGIAEALEQVFASFAAHAPGDTALVVKTHPLDNGLEHWPTVVSRLATEHHLVHRVVFLDGGRLDSLIAAARGMVTINSTAGIEALQAGLPVKTLGTAIYDVAGLTHQGPLDSFWQAPPAPERPLVDDFVTALAATVQVRGTLYSDSGLRAAAHNMAQRILRNALNRPLGDAQPTTEAREARRSQH